MQTITPHEAHTLVTGDKASVIDVRTPNEFAGEHIHGAQNININDPLFSEKIKTLNKEAVYIVNCQMGGRSARATSLMNELGFKKAMNLEGGISAWKRENLPTER